MDVTPKSSSYISTIECDHVLFFFEGRCLYLPRKTWHQWKGHFCKESFSESQEGYSTSYWISGSSRVIVQHIFWHSATIIGTPFFIEGSGWSRVASNFWFTRKLDPCNQRNTQLVCTQHHCMDTDTRKLVNYPSSSPDTPTQIRFHWICSPCATAKQTSYVFTTYELRTFIAFSWPSLLVSDGPASHLHQVFQSWLVFCGQPIGHKCFQPASSNLLLTYFDMCIGNGISFAIMEDAPAALYAISSDFLSLKCIQCEFSGIHTRSCGRATRTTSSVSLSTDQQFIAN